ncbi:MAG: DUF3307 domain-containing protein [Acidobacteriota bacterium]
MRVLVAHFVSDYILQSSAMAASKDERGIKTWYFYAHILITLLSLFIFLWSFDYWKLILLVAASHFLIDAAKSIILKTGYIRGKIVKLDLWIFLADQLMHLIVLVLLWLAFTRQFQLFFPGIATALSNIKFWWLLLAYILLTNPSSVLIGKITQRWSNELLSMDEPEAPGLKFAGKWIGIFERVLIFTFIIINQFSGVGFLLAAKSVFRFGDLKENSQHKKTEYIIIGTLLSFSIAILTGLIFQYIINSFSK